jgi:hypothetical protein
LVGGYGVFAALLLVIFIPLLAFLLGEVLVRRHVDAATPFEHLPREARQQGLLLAWDSGPIVVPMPGLLAVPYLATLVGAFEVSTSVGFDAGRAILSCAVVLLAAFAGAAHQHFLLEPSQRRSALRTAAEQWCVRWHDAWVARAGVLAGERAAQRFRLPDDVETYPLHLFGLPAQTDMPPAFVDIRVLLTGAFLAIREGAYVNVKGTSLRQGSSDAPDTLTEPLVDDDSTKVSEREAHYQDLVTVDYERTAATRPGHFGMFRLNLSSGQRIEFPTSEQQGVSSALEAIRLRTRTAKLG